jgi:hypothetical protein
MAQREPARTCEDLIVWQKAHAFVIDVYRMTAGFPREEARYYLRLARDLGYTADTALTEHATEVGRLPGSYARTILSSSS